MVERYGPGLMYVLCREIGNRDVVEDVYQETFRIVLERLRNGSLEKPDKLAGFVVGVARRLAKVYRRARWREVCATDVLERMDNGEPSAYEQVIRHEQARAVRTAIQQLTVSRDRDLLTRRYLLEQGKRRICEDCALDSRLFDKTIYRARRRLRKKIAIDLPAAGELLCDTLP